MENLTYTLYWLEGYLNVATEIKFVTKKQIEKMIKKLSEQL